MSQELTPFGFESDDVQRTVKGGVEFFHLVGVCRKLGIGESAARDWARRLPKASVVKDDARNQRGELRETTFVNADVIRVVSEGLKEE